MNYRLLYQWEKEIATELPCLNSWQAANVALFSLGVIEAGKCQQQEVAYKVATGERVESCMRRWRRFQANKGLAMSTFFGQWSRWLLRALGRRQVHLLVDETKLQDRIGALVVGVAWEGRCIPLAWRCYKADDKEAYPEEGQVAVIATLLSQIQAGLDDAYEVTVMADRGIGNSGDLCQAVMKLGWNFLFRVTANCKVVIGEEKHRITELVQPGQARSVAGQLFTSNAGGFFGYAHAIWDKAHDKPWALVTNSPTLPGRDYAQRNWEEQGFRDLKSGGWQWQTSRIRQPEHMSRLLILLALAYAWCLALGSEAVRRRPSRPLVRSSDSGSRPRRHWSLFKEGLAYYVESVRRHTHFVRLHFAPDPRL